MIEGPREILKLHDALKRVVVAAKAALLKFEHNDMEETQAHLELIKEAFEDISELVSDT